MKYLIKILSLFIFANFIKFNVKGLDKFEIVKLEHFDEKLDSAKIEQFKNLFKQYLNKFRYIDIDKVTDSEKLIIDELAKKVEEFKKQLLNANVSLENLDDFVRNMIQHDAGNFKSICKQDFKNLYNNNNYLITWLSVENSIANLFKNGQFKLDINFFNRLRGCSSSQFLTPKYRNCEGGLNLYGGLFLHSCFDDVKENYKFIDSNFLNENLKKLEFNVSNLYTTLGFAIDLNSCKMIDFEDLRRKIDLLIYYYLEDSDFINLFLKLKSRIENFDEEGCFHEFEYILDFFDYKTQVENQVQKEKLGYCEYDLIDYEKPDKEILDSKLTKFVKSYTFLENVSEKLIKNKKKSYINNFYCYLMQNKALIAKLLGFDAICMPYYGGCNVILINADKVFICNEEFGDSKE